MWRVVGFIAGQILITALAILLAIHIDSTTVLSPPWEEFDLFLYIVLLDMMMNVVWIAISTSHTKRLV